MATSVSPNNSLFWSQSLAEELSRFFVRRLKCPETAADLTHEIYLRMDRKFKENPHDNARALAFRIALNLAIDYQRKATVRNQYNTDMEIDCALEISPDRTPSVSQTLIAREQLSSVRQALDELPVNCRTAFYLHSLEGLTYSEIANRMGISKSMVNKLLAQAMSTCKARLGK